MKTTVTSSQQLSADSQELIRRMFRNIDSMLVRYIFWKSHELENAMEQMLQGDFTTPTFSHQEIKVAYLIIRRQILHILSLESTINENKVRQRESKLNQKEHKTYQKENRFRTHINPHFLTHSKEINNLNTPKNLNHSKDLRPP